MFEFNREMLTLARESRQMTQTQFALASDISQSKVSKYEGGLLNVSDSDIETISRVLNYPQAFFSQNDEIFGSNSPCFYNRKRKMIPMILLRSIYARINILRFAARRFLRGAEVIPANEFPSFDIDEFDGKPDEVARRVRAVWGMPIGPVKSVVAAIEAAGGIVIGFSFGTTKIDAVSQRPKDMPPIFFVNTDIEAGDRLRYTLAHELGHIVMQNAMSNDPEEEADQFAREFLMPAREIGRDLVRIDIGRAARLKPFWRTSMQSLIARAYELRAITKSKYTSLFIEIGRLGFRLQEPIPIPPERPTITPEIVLIYIDEYKYSIVDLTKLVNLSESDLRGPFLPDEQGHPNLKLVR
jgi:Zn-dependent peptidase ImmA (M78 family)/transcriptional regulator with XRE-family HTH domain